MWDRPDDLIGRADVDKIIQEPPHKKGMEEVKKLSKFYIRNLSSTFNILLIILQKMRGRLEIICICKEYKKRSIWDMGNSLLLSFEFSNRDI